MRGALSLAVLLAIAGPNVHAASETEAFGEAVVELTINGQESPVTLVLRRDADGTLLLKASDLAALRIKQPADGAVMLDGERYFRLGVEIGASVAFDPATQHADVTLPPGAFTTTLSSLSSPDAPPAITPSLGGFVNYDLYGESTSTRTSLGGIAEAGIFSPYGVVTNTLLGRDEQGSRSAVRLESTWTLDLPERTATLRVGDAISASGAWGRSVRLGGVQFGTNFATQPTLVTTPLLAARGDALVPSTVDVFVNGQQVASESVPPGPFTIDRVPTITGAGQMQVVVTDALGRQQVIAQPYYTGSSLLRAGLNECSFEAGAIREDYGLRSDAYGGLVLAATFRRGLNDQLTAEVHAEGQAQGPQAIGVDTAWQVGTLGVLTATAAVGGDGDMGWLGGLGLEHSARSFNVFARTQFASESFAQLGTTAEENRPKQRTFGGLGFDFGVYGNLQMAYGLQTYWSGPRDETIGISHSLTLGSYGFLNLIASQRIGGDSSTDLFLNWTLSFGERRSAAVSLRHASDAPQGEEFEAVASVQQSLPAGSGAGYQVSLSSNEEAQLGYAYQGAGGRAGLQYARRDGADGWRAEASGGLAITSAGVMPARRLDRSFAVVKVADFPDLTIYVENQPVGRTDSKGRVLLDTLRPYERNQISIDPKQLPLEASLAVPVMQVTPAYRSGAVVQFPVTRARAATLRLVQPEGKPVPPGATVRLDAATAPVGLDGLVYLEDAAGHHEAVAEWPDHRCAFSFARTDSGDPVPDLGTIPCFPVSE